MDHARSDADRARVFTDRIGCMWYQGRKADAVAAADRAVGLAREVGDTDLRALALGRQANALAMTGRSSEAAAAVADAAALGEQAMPATRGLIAGAGALVAGSQGDLGEARRLYAEAAARFREAGDLRRAARNEMNFADSLNRIGAYADAERELGAAAENCRRVGYRHGEALAHVNRGYALVMQGRGEDALAVLEAARTIGESTRSAASLLPTRLFSVRARLLTSASASLASEAETVAADAEKVGYADLRALSWAVAADAWLRCGDALRAEDAARRAVRVRDELGGVSQDEAELFLILARALHANGRPDEASDVLSRGRARVEELAAGIQDEVLRARFRNDVAAHRELLRADLAASEPS
jgi:tetratricopeptide (TPR) repeat protein